MNRLTPITPNPRRSAATRGGLALVELVAVLVVLAAIALVAVPRLGRAETVDLGASARGDLAVLRNAIELYAADHGGAYPPLEGFEAALTGPAGGQGPYLQGIPGPDAGSTEATGLPRIAAFPAPGPAAAGPSAPPAVWFYDEQSGRIRPNPAAPR